MKENGPGLSGASYDCKTAANGGKGPHSHTEEVGQQKMRAVRLAVGRPRAEKRRSNVKYGTTPQSMLRPKVGDGGPRRSGAPSGISAAADSLTLGPKCIVGT